MDDNIQENLKKISAVLFLNNEAINITKLKKMADLENLSAKELENIFVLLNQKLNDLGLVLIRDSNKNLEKQEVIIVVKKEMAEIAQNLKKEELQSELTPSALQVLTICIYLNGATKQEISLIRGMQSNQSLRSLSSRGLIKNDNGRYFPSIECLQNLGLAKLEDLPEFEKIQKDFQEKLQEFICS